jgi:hypothetical protein
MAQFQVGCSDYTVIYVIILCFNFTLYCRLVVRGASGVLYETCAEVLKADFLLSFCFLAVANIQGMYSQFPYGKISWKCLQYGMRKIICSPIMVIS